MAEMVNMSWRKSHLYLAPSSHAGGGWGVFSSRSIAVGDMVEMAPLLLRFSEREPRVLKDSILNNYHYQYWAWNGATLSSQFVLSFGYMLYFNHSSQPNLKYKQFGQEPDVENPGNSVALGYYALCDIPPNTELFCDYGGTDWFRDRGLEYVDSVNEQRSPSDDHREALHGISQPLVKSKQIEASTSAPSASILTSKLYAGYDRKSIKRILDCHKEGLDIYTYNLDSIYLKIYPCRKGSDREPNMTGFGNVVSREDVEEGATLEISPSSCLRKHQ